VAVRVAATAWFGFSTPHFADAPAYLFAAKALAQTGTYPLRTDKNFFRPPGYSVFLDLVTLGHPENIALAKGANALLGALGPLLLAAIALRLFRSRAAALAAGVAAAFDPSLILVSSDVQSEPLFFVLLLLSGFFLLVCVDRPSSNFGVLAGALLGLAALTRPSALCVVPLLFGPLADRRYPLRVRWHLAASALLGFVLSLAPWTLRNAVVYREFIPISDVGGFNFYVGNSEPMARFFQVRTKQEYETWAEEADHFLDLRVAALRAAGFDSPGALTSELVRITVAQGLAAPGAAARLLWHKALDWLRPYPNPLFWPTPVVVGIGLLYGGLTLLAARGLLIGPRRGASLFCVGLLVLSMAAHVLTVVSWRYRVPYWDPVLILYGAFGVLRGRSG
jgi:4-amino-4-deoxy-L-arabinose transferase-like glycosyltransferase